MPYPPKFRALTAVSRPCASAPLPPPRPDMRHPSLHRTCRSLLATALLALPALAQGGEPQPGQQPGQPNAQPPGQEPGAQQPQGQGGEQPQGAPQATEPSGKWFRGRSWTRYWLRWEGGDKDQDLFETLSLDLGDASKDPVSVHFMGRLAADLDGYDDTFRGLSDSYGHRTDALLYDLYLDLHRLPGIDVLRVGRQTLYETPEFAYLDGLRVDSEEFGALKLQLGAYVGASTHLYESSHSGDLTAGAFASVRPWAGGRVRLDYMHLEDRALLGDHRDDLLGASWWQRLYEQLQFEAHYTRLENEDRDVRSRLYFTDAGSDLLLQVSYYQLLQPQGDLVLEADPFFNAVHELFPYTQWGLLASKGLGEHLDLQAGADLRRVEDESDVGTYNRDYERWFGTASVHDVLVDGLGASVTADVWNSNGQQVHSWGASVDKTFDRLTASVGTYYSLYKFDLYADRERDHVRTWFGRVRYKTGNDVNLDFDYEFEDDDFGHTQTVRMGVTWIF